MRSLERKIAMKVDVSAIMKVTGASIAVDGSVSFGSAGFLGESYTFEEPLAVKGEIYNNGQTLTLDVHVSGRMKTECSRCLKDIWVDVDYDIEEFLSRSESGGEQPEDEDMIFFEGHEVELDPIVYDRFLMELSGRYLCSEDCKGLCPVCGHDLNEGDCGCDREQIDPRWQALADILAQQKDE